MQKITLMLLAIILISGCAGSFQRSAKFDSSRASLDECDDKGGTHINLYYGNNRIKTAGSADLARGEIFAIRLKPENTPNNRPGISYDDVDVTISGKGSATWLTAGPESYNDLPGPHHELIICVPPGTPISDDYFYNIEIVSTGNIDPRAKVKK